MDVELKLHAQAAPTAQPYAAVKALPLKLRKSMTIERAFQEISRNCLTQIQANEPGVALHYDQESLHQMRVGLRRLRSAFGLFKGVIQIPSDLHQEINWLSRQLGVARDWDVLSGSTLPMLMQAAPDDTQLAKLQQAVLAQAKEVHATASAAVDSARYTRFILCLNRCLLGRTWREPASRSDQKLLKAGVKDFAKTLLKHGARRLLKHGRRFDRLSTMQRHRVRIAAKKMRYATEFFQALYSEKKVRAYVEVLAKLQDQLGWLNDVAVADRLLQELKQAKLNRSIEFAKTYLASSANLKDQKICKLWKKLRTIKYPS